jgi:hypothetical protein
MGYYASISDADWFMSAKHEEAALQTLKDLNKPENDHLKNGGSWSGGEKTSSWYSWMPSDYDQHVVSVAQVLEMLGFEVEATDAGTRILFYDSKVGNENVFLAALAPYVEDGSYIVWTGEDGARWRHIYEGGKMYEQVPTITWGPEKAELGWG